MVAVKVVLFLDGRPGHEKQSRGVLRALGDYLALDVQEIVVPQRTNLQRLLELFGYFFYLGSAPALKFTPDLIIGTGSRTHVPVLQCKRKQGGRALTCMAPSVLLRSKFDLCFVPHHDSLAPRSNVFATIGPPNLAVSAAMHDYNKSLILIGGEDNRSHYWNSNKLLQNINELLDSTRKQQWTISGSPRTPPHTDELLMKLAEGREGVTYVPFSQTATGWIEQQYDLHKVVWVTADSVSMVYEALSAGCSVGVIPVEWKQKNNKFRKGLRFLIETKRVVTLAQYLAGDILHQESEPLAEAAACAREIVKRWWQKELP